jgi:outer membrane receptor protein involved in Fe transport
MRKIRHLALSTICTALPMAGWAQAVTTAGAPATPKQAVDVAPLETVTITSTKRAESARDVPQTIEVYSQQALQDMGAKDVSDVIKATPGVELRASQPGVGGVAIRGIAELNVANLYGGTGSATALYLDEMALTAAGFFPQVNTFDLERVEILKGPQGTLFGEGSLAGTIRLITRKPDLKSFSTAVDADADAVKGGGKGNSLDAMVNIPLATNVAAMRATVFHREDPGYVSTRLASTGEIVSDTNTNRSNGGRVTFRLKPNAVDLFDLTLMTSDARRGGTNLATDDFTDTHSVLEHANDRTNAGNLTYQRAASGADLVVTASKIKRTVNQVTDQLGLVAETNLLDGALNQATGGALGLPTVTGVYAPQDITTDSSSLEVRAVSNGSGPLKWTVGAFYKKNDTNYLLTSQSVPQTLPTQYSAVSQILTGGAYSDPYSILSASTGSTKQTALFGETSYDLTPSMQLLGGLRLFREQRSSTTQYGGVILFVAPLLSPGASITPPGTVSSSASNTLVNPKLTLSYKPASNVLTYATVSRGFRSGGQNDLFFTVAGGQPTFDPETLTNYELGMKSDYFARRVFVDASVYTLDWRNLQEVIGKGPGGAGEVIGNIGQARSSGIDLSLRARPTAGLELMAGLSLIDAKTRNAVTLPDPSGNGSINVASGARLPRTAKQTLNLAATYRHELTDALTGLVRLGVSHVGDSVSYLYQEDQKVNAYTTVDLKFGVESERWEAYAYATNLTNQKIQLYQETFNDPTNNKPQYYYGRPRTVGVNLRYAFE